MLLKKLSQKMKKQSILHDLIKNEKSLLSKSQLLSFLLYLI